MDQRDEKVIEAMIRCFLYPETQTLITCKDEESMKDVHERALNIIKEHECEHEIKSIQETLITFKNGSTIQALHPSVCGETIRGKRANINPFLYDWERVDLNDFDEVIRNIVNIEM